MKLTKLSQKILVGLTGHTEKQWRSKLKEIKKFKIRKISLFLERLSLKQRRKIYLALLKSGVKNIPVVHARNDMTSEEFAFLKNNFGTLYFTIHEGHFRYLPRWKGFHKNLYLEMHADNFIPAVIKMKKIGGFCIDLAHFKKSEDRWTEEFDYVMKREKILKYFACNHLNGYSYRQKTDLHTIKHLKDLNYLKTLPKFLFSKNIALEMSNSISQQLKFKKYLIKMFS